MRLAQYIREVALLTGTKVSCAGKLSLSCHTSCHTGVLCRGRVWRLHCHCQQGGEVEISELGELVQMTT